MAHQFARDLLAGPDLPIFHFDPSRAGTDSERDTSTSEPRVERVQATRRISFLTIVGETDDEGEAVTDGEQKLHEELAAARAELKRFQDAFDAQPWATDEPARVQLDRVTAQLAKLEYRAINAEGMARAKIQHDALMAQMKASGVRTENTVTRAGDYLANLWRRMKGGK